ncbi:Agamous-like MADS-box protein [Melia azedarach]|uniref:Agamous-like MADS-box protein n=1 Tax=Melia azedarach TaxID=155640 RepID=A0ACC1XYS9_MELAZ|nr:Agamous-like MADS-box protein [Melia azedarach]
MDNSRSNEKVNDENRRNTTKGRQKIEIKKLEDKNSLQVTFSKRRSGLFTKAMELCVLCGAEVGIVVFSPNRKTFLVGHPDFDTILNRYLNENQSNAEVVTIPSVQQHNKEYEEAMKELEKEKKRGKMIEEEKKNKNGGFWWEEPIDEMGMEELEEYVKAVKRLRGKVESRVTEMMISEYLVPNNEQDLLGDTVVSGNEARDCH